MRKMNPGPRDGRREHRQDRVRREDGRDVEGATSQGLAGAISTDDPKATLTTPLASKDTW